MKKYLLGFGLILICNSVLHCQNIVPNYSFEKQFSTDYCDCLGTNIDFCFTPNIQDFVYNWFQPNIGTSDIFNDTISQNCYSSPYSQGLQFSRTGHCFAGIIVYSNNFDFDYKEYLGVKLPIPIIPNIKYDCYFHTVLSKNCKYASNNVGMLLSDSLYEPCTQGFLINKPPTFFSSEIILNDSTWMEIRDTISVTDTLHYLYIGNFFPKKQIKIKDRGNKNLNYAFYFIDDVVITPIFDSIVIDTICSGSSYTFKSIQNAPYILYYLENFELLHSSNFDFTYTPNSNSTFMQVFNGKTIKYEIYIDPYINLGVDTSILIGNSIVLKGNNPKYNYIWSTGETTPSIEVKNEGLYSVTATNSSGCSSTDDIYISVDLYDTPHITGNNACENTECRYTANTKYPPNTKFIWTAFGGEILNDSIGIDKYTVDVKWGNAYQYAAVFLQVIPPNYTKSIKEKLMVNVIENPKFTIEGVQDVCKGDTAIYNLHYNSANLILQNLSIASEENEPNNPFYNEFWNGFDTLVIEKNSEQNQILVNWKQKGTDKIYATISNNGCSSTESLNISIHNIPTPNFTYNTIKRVITRNENKSIFIDSIFVNERVYFTNTTFESIENSNDYQNISFLWDFLNNNDYVTKTVSNPTYVYSDTGFYMVNLKIIDQNWGCTQTISKPIHIIDIKNCGITFPNTFTPELSENNIFYPIFTAGISENNYELRVYNRWGTLVWSTHNIEDGWDGTYKNEYVKQDVYVYICTAQCKQKDSDLESPHTIFIKKDITVLR